MKTITSEVSAKKEQYGDLVVTVHDQYGNLLQELEQPVDSFNDQLWRVFHMNTNTGNDFITLRALNNSNVENRFGINGLFYDASLNDNRSIVVGSGTNQTGISTNTLQTIITTANYQVNTLTYLVTTAEFDATTGVATLTRSFYSNHPDSSNINVNEVGIAFNRDGGGAAGTNNAFLGVRDVLSSTVVVPPLSTLTVQYKVRISNGNNNLTNVFIRPFGVPFATQNFALANTTGSIISAGVGALVCLSAEGFTLAGLKMGTSNTAFAKTQNDLVSTIAHGNSAGQLFYHATSSSPVTINTTTNSLFFKFYRPVENRSGSNISVSEVGIFTQGGVGGQSFMLDRRVVDPPVTVTNGDSVTFVWEFCYEV